MEKEIETQYRTSPVCPYCGEEIEDWGDLDIEDDTESEVTCEGCEKDFIFIPHQEWSFNSFKKEL